jgi:hypothetical protein
MKSRNHLFVVCQHGSHGHCSQFEFLKSTLLAAWDEHTKRNPQCEHDVRVWDTDVNNALKSDAGVKVCTNRLLKELEAALSLWVQESRRSEGTSDVKHQFWFSCIGHSFGGVLLRALLPSLLQLPVVQSESIQLLTYVSIATPHCGVEDLNALFRVGGKLIGKVYSQTYCDLLLMNDCLPEELISSAYLEPLNDFRERILYGNLHGDPLVSFPTSTLLSHRDVSGFTLTPSAVIQDALQVAVDDGFPHLRPGGRIGKSIESTEAEEGSSAFKAGSKQERIRSTILNRTHFLVFPIDHHTRIPVAHDGALGLNRFGYTMKDVPTHAALTLLAEFVRVAQT